MRVAVALTLVAVARSALPSTASAQCVPPSGTNDAKLLAFYEAPIAFTLGGAPERLTRGEVRVGAELTGIPHPGDIEAPEYCYRGGTENTRLAPVFPRPRLAVGLGRGLFVEASYVPPVSLFDAEPHLGSLAVGHVRTLRQSPNGRETLLTVRAHATLGRVRGAITCPRDALQSSDPNGPCFGQRSSSDTFRPHMFGAEAAVGTSRGGGTIAFYGGAGVTWLRPRFKVGFTDNTGYIDSTRVEVNLTRLTLLGGATWRFVRTVALSAQIYSVPRDVTTWRVGADYRIR